jgi:hypothetical protein
LLFLGLSPSQSKTLLLSNTALSAFISILVEKIDTASSLDFDG